MAANDVDITILVRGVDEAKRQMDDLKRAVLGLRVAGLGAGVAGAGAAGAAAPWWQNPFAIAGGASAAAGIVPPAGALLGLGAFGAVAGASGVLKKTMTEMKTQFDQMAKSLTPMITQALKPMLQLFHDLLPLIRELAIAGGKIFDAFVKPLDGLVKSGLFDEFIHVMGQVGLQFAQLFGPVLAKVLGDVLRLFIQLAPAGMALWRALGPLVQVLVYQLAGVLGKLLPPLARALGSLLSAITPLIPPLAKMLIENLVPWAKVIAALAPLVGKLAQVLSMQLLRALMPLAKASADLVNALLPLIPPLVKLLNVILPPLINILNKPLLAAITAVARVLTVTLGAAITWFVNTAVPWLKQNTEKIAGFFQNLGPNLAKYGKQAFMALWDAIKSTASQIWTWAKNWVANFGGIFSPLLGILGHLGIHLGSSGSSGPTSGQPAANAALARRMMPAWGTGANWSAWNYVAMRESGWNNYAQNPTSGAYGIPQALPPSKMPFAAQAAGGSQPAAQIAWMIAYMGNRYGGPQGAAAHESQFGWYDRGGWLPRGLSLALNTTGRPERILPPGGSDPGGRLVVEVRTAGADDAFLRWLRQAIRVRGGNVQQVLGR